MVYVAAVLSVLALPVLWLWLLYMFGSPLSESSTEKTRKSAWAEFARQRQLAYADDQIAGVISGLSVALLQESVGTGKDRYDVGLARCSLGGALPAGFRLEREGLDAKVQHLLGDTDPLLGDPELDAAFWLSNVTSEVRRVFRDYDVRTMMLEMVDRYPRMRIGNGAVQLEKFGAPRTAKQLAALLDDALLVAVTLRRAASKW